MTNFRLACCIAFLMSTAARGGEPAPQALDNASIVSMTQAGLPESTIVLAIEANECHFDLAPAQLIQLHRENVTDGVIRAMLAAGKGAAALAPPGSSATDPTAPLNRAHRAAYPVQFFAQRVVTRKREVASTDTLYVGAQRLRLESAHETLILDPATLTGYFWHSGQPLRITHELEGVLGVKEGEGPSRYLLPADPAQPCARWLNLTCRRIGADAVAGRPAVKWEMTRFFDGDTTATGFVWVDVRLHVVSRLQEGTSIEELRDVIERDQPATLFEPPAN
jgi:hypothetical protein